MVTREGLTGSRVSAFLILSVFAVCSGFCGAVGEDWNEDTYRTTLLEKSAGAAEMGYPIKPVSFSEVQVGEGFWSSRIGTNRNVTIEKLFERCEQTGRIENFAKAAGKIQGGHKGIYFNDSDVYKAIEAAAYSLRKHPDPELEAYVDGVIELIAEAQWDDGYLYTYYSIPEKKPELRWSNIRVRHELYCAGHLYEAAVAYYQATDKRKILDAAVKNADLIDRVFGSDGHREPPGHQEIEIGLVKLYRVTGKEKYLRLAKFFLEQRGRSEGHNLYGKYSQDHKPVAEQSEAVGHAVRAAYMYSGMADVSSLTGDAEYIEALERIWQNVVSRKLYVTGSVGARHGGESFGKNYQLPNESAYNETCAAIGNAMWNHRMFLVHGGGRYIDVLERIIYNGFLSGVSLGGDRFFYRNPLSSEGKSRRPWFGCACCPPNIGRFIASLPGYVYAHRGDELYVNLFVSGSAEVKLAEGEVEISQQTRYPWEGKVRISVNPEESSSFAVNVRVPGWARNRPVPSELYSFACKSEERATLKLNGRVIEPDMESGFARIERAWEKGDVIELELPMPVRRVLTHPKVKANDGRVAIQRGPIVYCAEWIDNGGFVRDITLPDDAELRAEHRSDLLGGLTVVKSSEADVCLIPYYAWAHRGIGEMSVWLPRNKSLAKAKPAGVLDAGSFKHHVDYFNNMEEEGIVNYIPNSEAWEWMKRNIPLFECPDEDFEEIYYYRWWTYRKHIKQTPDGFVVTEFLDDVGHAGKHNTISCALGHHIYEGRWLHNDRYLNQYIKFWLRGNDGEAQPHLHKYSNWLADGVYNRYLVTGDGDFAAGLLYDLIEDFRRWEKEKQLPSGLYWQYDVWDGMEESISGSRHKKNTRPPLNSYIYANAEAISEIARLGRSKALGSERELADKFAREAARIKSLVQTLLWDEDGLFFKVRLEDDGLADVREEIGYIPWQFNLPDEGYEPAWLQILDPCGFKAPMGLTTAERRHPEFRSHGVGTCEWDGAVWPYATTQTLAGLANLLNDYEQSYVSKRDYFEALADYVKGHHRKGKPYIGEYLDEVNGKWLTPDSPRSRYYNHSGFCDLIITGLVGLRPGSGDKIEVNSLLPRNEWDWFCVDNIRYGGRLITILWDKTGRKYHKGKGFKVYADGELIAESKRLERIAASLP